MLDRIIEATLPNKLFPLVHTHVVSPLPSVASGTQVLTQLLGIQNRHESWIVRCSPWPHAPGFSQNNQRNCKLTLPPLSLDQYQKKKDEILDPPCIAHPLMKPGTREMR